MRFKRINGFFFGKLLFNYYFDEGFYDVHNYVRRGRISLTDTTAVAVIDNSNYIEFSASATKPSYEEYNIFGEVSLCGYEDNKTTSNDPCVCNILF